MRVTQDLFRGALLDSARPAPEGLSDGHGRPAGRRFSVYRNNVAVSLTEALELGFPVLRKLIGEDNFRALAGVFLRRHPPDHPIIALYGARLPGFLTDFAPLSHLGYLTDIARLEQALRESHHAADSTPVDPAVLQEMPVDSLLRSRILLAPALRLIRSPWPIHAIWTYNMEPGSPQPKPEAQNVLITRPGFDTEMSVLAAGDAEFVAALTQGARFGRAHDRATDTDADFDLARILGLLIGGHAITAINEGSSA